MNYYEHLNKDSRERKKKAKNIVGKSPLNQDNTKIRVIKIISEIPSQIVSNHFRLSFHSDVREKVQFQLNIAFDIPKCWNELQIGESICWNAFKVISFTSKNIPIVSILFFLSFTCYIFVFNSFCFLSLWRLVTSNNEANKRLGCYIQKSRRTFFRSDHMAFAYECDQFDFY